jgi:hypothetical protein
MDPSRLRPDWVENPEKSNAVISKKHCDSKIQVVGCAQPTINGHVIIWRVAERKELL